MKSLFYRNPRLTALTLGLILVAGLSSFYVLPRMEDPLLTERIAIVNTRFPGAEAERVESQVTEKLEDELREIEQIKEIRSVSLAGISTLTIELRDDVYQDETPAVWSRARDKLDDAKQEMPRGVLDPKFDRIDMKAYAMLVSLRWTQDTEPNFAILRRLTRQLEDELRAVSGTEEVDTFGEPDEEITVEIDPEKLTAIGMGIRNGIGQVEASDAKVAAGQVRGRGKDLLVEIEGELDSLERIENIPLRVGAEGRTIRLGDVADVRKGITDPPTDLALVRGDPALVLGVLSRNEQRIDHWTSEIHQRLADFEQRLPEGVTLTVVFEQNHYVEERLDSLLGNLLLGAAAVTLVIFVLMGWRSAIIVASSLPLAALMVLAGLRLLGIPVHQMSVTGLILALGLLIDNAIVMVDDVREKLRDGMAPSEAVAASVSHLAIPLLGSTLTTALAFAPIALMPGPAGEFVGSIAISVILAIASSLLLAMTIVPTLTAMVERASERVQRSTWWQAGFSNEKLTRLYAGTLRMLFHRPILGMVLASVVPILGFVQARHLTEQFFPPADRDQFYIELELPPSTSLAKTRETTLAVRKALLAHEQVQSVDWFLGQSMPSFYYNVIRQREGTPHYAQAMVQLKSAEGARALIHRLQDELDADFPHARILVRQLEQGPPFDAPVEVRIFGPDPETLRNLGQEIRLTLAETPDVIHVRSEMAETLPKLSVVVDEEEARLAGLNLRNVADQMNLLLEGSPRGSVLEGTEELPVRLRVQLTRRATVANLVSLDLFAERTPSVGGSYPGIPTEALASVRLKPEQASMIRINGRRLNEVKAYIKAGVLPAQVQADFQQRLEAKGFELPPGYKLKFGGESAERDDAVNNLMASVGVLLVLMIATLVLSFNSFRLAGLIGVVAVLSVGLGLGSLWVFGYPFGFMAIVGTMGLVGVAINDAIVVLAALREDELAKVGDVEAMSEVVLRSTRHVVATSLTTIAGFLPLVLAGGGFWPPLAIAIAGGVGGATVLALYFVPSAYLLLMGRSG